MATVCNLDWNGPSAPDAVRHDDGGEGEGESAKDSSHLDRVGAQFNGLSFTHISLLTEVLTAINLAAILHNTVHLCELSTEPNENTITV